MSGGKWKVPLVVRATMGATRRSAAQHSQSLHAWPAHIPGLKVVVPSTPADAKGLLKSAIRDDNPVVFFEDKISYTKVKGPVPEGEYTIPLGVADVKRSGHDITLVGTSSMVQVALGAAAMLEERRHQTPRSWIRARRGRSTKRTLIESVKKTSRCIVDRRGLWPLRRHRRAGVGHLGRGLLRSRWSGAPHRRHARADSVLAAARGRHRADRTAGVRAGAADVQPVRQVLGLGSRFWVQAFEVAMGDQDLRNDGGGLGAADRLRSPSSRAARPGEGAARQVGTRARCSAST